MQLFKRFEKNPILEPTSNPWESKAVFNAAAAKVGSEIKLLYRAVGDDNISRIGIATSYDGYTFSRQDQPILEGQANNPYETRGIEDPRITFLDGYYNILYVAASLYPEGHPKPVWAYDAPWRVRIALARTKDFVNFERDGVVIKDRDSKDPALFGERIADKLYLIHRIYPSVWLSVGREWGVWESHKCILEPRKGMWDGERIGAGPPPIKTKEGWLLIYHGKDREGVYRSGAALLDSKDPSRVLARSSEPFLEPEAEHEKGIISGNKSVAVFSCGVISQASELIVYYGAADRVLCVGTISINELLGTLEPEKVSKGVQI